ncbi:MAG: dihydrodipicolinate synthase family protein [Firmicutes bacterium]|jgi:4-hydroxy-tetrahydrodipicolinate synthase|nr:dihydrodipicolinate synthase family protein [Bacillota bacterium]MDH7496137.1 dihydrodipicolinate synthase family protein [Bacillota bacterium]
MQDMKRLRGIAPAVLTPFGKDGNIDFEALAAHCDYLMNARVDALYALGTTGEVFLLDVEERRTVAEFIVKHVAGRIPVFVQVGAIPTKVACELAAHAESIGADGIGAITPYYFHADQRALVDYYEAIAASVSRSFPIYLYNLPGCTTNDLLPETVRELATVPNIVGIKNSMADMERLTSLVEAAPDDFDVIMGADTLLYPALVSGAKGAVSGNANVFPEAFVGLFTAVNAEDHEKAGRYHRFIRKAAFALKNGSNLAYFKQALEFRGFKKTYTRAPLLDLTDVEKAELKQQMEALMKELETL